MITSSSTPRATISTVKDTKAILSDIIATFGYTVDDNDVGRGFMAYGIDSVEVKQILKQLGKRVGMDLNSTLMFDYPSVLELSAHVDELRQEAATDCASKEAAKVGASSMGSVRDILINIVNDLGYKVDRNDLTKGFMSLGIDSVEIGQIGRRLGSMLSMQLGSTLVLDYPSIHELSDHVEELRKLSTSACVDEQDLTMRKKLRWDSMTAEDVAFVLGEMRRAYVSPEIQAAFRAYAQASYPNELMYSFAIQPTCQAAQDRILRRHGLVKGAVTPQAAAVSTRKFERVAMSLWRASPVISELYQAMTQARGMDQVLPKKE